MIVLYNDCIVREVYINYLKHDIFYPCVINTAEGDRYSQLFKCHHLPSFEATEMKG
jgi:hypothetical protein